MAYDPCKLNKDVRMYLGGIDEEKLPENVVVYWGDFYDAQPKWTGNYPYILWQTTLCCLQYLKASIATSTTSTKSTSKEKVGDVEINISNDYSSTEDLMNAYDELYKDYLANPDKFGLYLDKANVVHVGGVYQEEVDYNRTNTNVTSTYNPLPVTAFPKRTQTPYRRSPVDTKGVYRKRR